ncbi:calpain-5-like [Ylistrum balloti]|uniref:calpain-5-like n=1 Tax=Ylistrum balloti TaxID=509963 RepID=UPI002905C684|nr:calpain-5-like [Ylistrum balloti]
MVKIKHLISNIMPTNYRGQKYSSIRSSHVKAGTLFEDPEFKINNKSLFFSKIDQDIEWKRPRELCKVPKLVVEGVSCDDLNQGELGNAWFVTACASLALEKKLFERVVPNVKEQDWNEREEKNTYGGVFHFVLWRYGEWIDVVVDDRLPTKNGKLVFCHSKSRNEFWSALLEKAYAKLYGDYESLNTGRTGDALVDFTGGVAEKLVMSRININDKNVKKQLFLKLKDASDNKALMNCNIQCQRTEVGKDTPQGLVLGHGYNITKVAEIIVDKKLQGAVGSPVLNMVRMANPWGTKEWTGAWSDDAPEWNKISRSEWHKIGLRFEQEGEFWMNFDDFVVNFTNVDICHFVNTAIFSIKKSWNECVFHGEWTVSGRNGGNDYNSPTFLSNPQYAFDVAGMSDNVMFSLEQQDIVHGQEFGRKLNKIGFQIMKVEENRKYRVHIQGEAVYCSEYIADRSIYGIVKLMKGRYVVLPTTTESTELGPFMLRMYSGSKASGSGKFSSPVEMEKECPSTTCPCTAKHKIVTTIHVTGAEGLELPTGSKVKTIDAYVVIRCEGEKVTSQTCPNSSQPKWEVKATFYRKKPDEPVVVEVWNDNVLIDDCLGEAHVSEEGSEQGDITTVDIMGRKKEKDIKKGKLHIFLRSSHDLQYL